MLAVDHHATDELLAEQRPLEVIAERRHARPLGDIDDARRGAKANRTERVLGSGSSAPLLVTAKCDGQSAIAGDGECADALRTTDLVRRDRDRIGSDRRE